VLVERIYQPTLKDVVSGIRQQRYYAQVSGVPAAATTITIDFPVVPPDTARFITNFAWLNSPGAAQFTEACSAFVNLNGVITGPVVYTMPRTRTVAAVSACNELVDILLLPGEALRMLVLFNAGAANNSFTGFVHGYDIPRANMQ
jgi:hypothetical protein